ncbi:MAG TPA: hypothetical protein VF753_00225 [Terriglobales bacterium]
MKIRLLLLVALLALCGTSLFAAENSAGTVPVRMVVSVTAVRDKTPPTLAKEDVLVRQGKQPLKVTGWTPAKSDNSPLGLFFMIDEASDTNLGSKLPEIQDFINAQATGTEFAVGYMHNNTFSILQDFTKDKDAAAKSLRLPMGSVGIGSSPYLSLIDLLKRWPSSGQRRAVVMITDGIDRFRGTRGMGTMNPDVDSASQRAQREGVQIFAIYTRGVGHIGMNYWAINTAQTWLSKLTDETGGQAYYLGTGEPVSFQPYFKSIQAILDNQYLLDFLAIPGKKSGLQKVKIFTEVPHAEIEAADNVWVPAPGDDKKQ